MLLCSIEKFIVALYFLIVLVAVLFPVVYSAKTIYRASFKKGKKAKYIDRIRYKE